MRVRRENRERKRGARKERENVLEMKENWVYNPYILPNRFGSLGPDPGLNRTGPSQSQQRP